MIALQIARIIAYISLFLDIDEDEMIDDRNALKMLEFLGPMIQDLDRSFLRELVDAFAEIAPEFTGKSEQLVRDIPFNFSLEETLAEGDPVRLAELEVEWHARMDAQIKAERLAKEAGDKAEGEVADD